MKYLSKEETALDKTSLSGNIVSEKPRIFDEYSTFFIPYTDRKDLTPSEKTCVGNYQDVHFWNTQKRNWSFKLPKHWETKPWCYAINSCFRDGAFYDLLIDEEKELIDFNIQNLRSAILKSKSDREYFVYRGVTDINWLKNPKVGTTYTDKGFGSFTLDFNRAYQYTDIENPIIFQLKIEKGMNVLFIDRAECEMLRLNNSEYIITDIEKIFFKKNLNKETTVYSIEIFKK
ncbi:hypothetical protein MmiHf6_10040 [Methanimicrococcus hongohii]|uniref:ADP-ribosyltransferase exoenzyme n=1 Tax=Methanimicrococcus hongohii TaxID=3028295 RepID=A0AA96ZTX9_9EURY|nr:ADP-ribosyltransferase [Methanimicrococcus sp. Hf6]WNY23691.1 hypothetical protein MmiHf6_10040 [Methanimicrococcus sp. Hf6]